jgi:poly-gamma-glutamate synthesis protein (capsule biosynthesis protein)
LIEAGADVIHGHHPHAVHPVGFHEGKPILYGLGTLVGQQVFLPAPASVQVLWAGMSPDGVLAELRLGDGEADLSLIPTTLDADRMPIQAQAEVFERIAARLARLSPPFGAAVIRDGNILRVAPLR